MVKIKYMHIFKYASLLFVSFYLSSSVSTAHAQIKIGLVLEKSGKDDKSFNASFTR